MGKKAKKKAAATKKKPKKAPTPDEGIDGEPLAAEGESLAKKSKNKKPNHELSLSSSSDDDDKDSDDKGTNVLLCAVETLKQNLLNSVDQSCVM